MTHGCRAGRFSNERRRTVDGTTIDVQHVRMTVDDNND